MKYFYTLFLSILLGTTLSAQITKEQQKVVNSSINKLFETFKKKDIEIIKPYLSKDISVSGMKGDIALKVLKIAIIQIKDVDTYTISSIKINGDYFNVTTTNGTDDDYNFVIDKSGKFEKIDMFKVQVQGPDHGATSTKLKNKEVVPFTYDGDLIVLKIGINNTPDTLNFVFDTGATNTVIDKKTAELLHLTSSGSSSANGASGKSDYNSAVISIHHNKVRVDSTEAIIVDLSHISTTLKYDGIVGATFLKKYVGKIDYINQEITFYNDISEVKNKLAKKQQIIFDGIQIPQIETSFTLKNGKKYSGKFFIDTGAALSLMLNTKFIEKNNLISEFDKKIETSFGSLTTTKSKSYKSTIGNLEFGEYSFEDVPTSLTNETSGVNSFEGFAGIIGNDIMKRLDLILDYKNKTIYFQPNEQFNKKFEYPCAGFDIKLKNGKVVARNLIKESDIHINGLRNGNTIISINNIPANKISFHQLKKLLKTDGETINLKFRNNKGEIQSFKYKANRLI